MSTTTIQESAEASVIAAAAVISGLLQAAKSKVDSTSLDNAAGRLQGHALVGTFMSIERELDAVRSQIEAAKDLARFL